MCIGLRVGLFQADDREHRIRQAAVGDGAVSGDVGALDVEQEVDVEEGEDESSPEQFGLMTLEESWHRILLGLKKVLRLNTLYTIEE